MRYRQCNGIFSSENYTVPLNVESFVDWLGSQEEESSTRGRASIPVAIFSEIAINTPKCVRAKITVFSNRITPP